MPDFSLLGPDVERLILTFQLRDKLVTNGLLWRIRTYDGRLHYELPPSKDKTLARMYNVRPLEVQLLNASN